MASAHVSAYARSPIRVDLAGGTVDLWPIYLLLPGAATINVGIDLWAEAWMEPLASDGADQLVFCSDDQNTEHRLPARELAHFAAPPTLDLHARILRAYLGRYEVSLKGSWKLRTRAKSPAGAGLGGSSALGISIASALFHWSHGRGPTDAEKWELIELVRDVESGVLYGPAGMQDYFGAAYGGLQKIEWKPALPVSTRYSDSLLGELESKLLVFYSGKSRNSGINNWLLYKNFIDRDPATTERFSKISAATRLLDEGLQNRDWEKVGQAIQQEWAARRELATGISTPEMDGFFAKISKLGVHAYKICGARGGGCFFVYHPVMPVDLKNQILSIAQESGFRPLGARCVNHGTETRS